MLWIFLEVPNKSLEDNSRRAFPFPGFGGVHTFFLSGTVAGGGCASALAFGFT
jgi:hypothetical protein